MAWPESIRSPEASRKIGVYGLQIDGLDAATIRMQPVAPGSPRLVVTVQEALPDCDRPSELTETSADLRLVGGGRLRMDRGADRARFSFERMPTPEELLHPYLAPAAALAQMWAGLEAFHAGAFMGRAGAVLLLGDKQAGKSTTLTFLARRHEVPVLTDDLAVVVDGSVLAGPRCIDLRDPGALEASLISEARPVRSPRRYRIGLDAAPAAVAIAAIVTLEWGARLQLRRIPMADGLRSLVAQRMYRASIAANHVALLELSAVPSFMLARPRGARGLAGAAAALLDVPT